MKAIASRNIPEPIKAEIKEYTKKHGYNEKLCILVDFSQHSGKLRLYIYDIQNDHIEESMLVAHGIGKNFECIISPKFSNEVGSNLSCVGKFKIGKQRKTNFKIGEHRLDCFELHGLDSTNSNAYRRGILIHTGLPSDIPTYPIPCIPASKGCFTVTNYTFSAIENIKNNSDKPILLYAFK